MINVKLGGEYRYWDNESNQLFRVKVVCFEVHAPQGFYVQFIGDAPSWARNGKTMNEYYQEIANYKFSDQEKYGIVSLQEAQEHFTKG